MGAEDLSDAMKRAALCLSWMAIVAAPALDAQSTLPRDFERVHFARAEAALDRAFGAAGTRVREESIRKIRQALEIRGWADSLAGTRAMRLATAWAKTAGFAEDDAAVAQRLDWFLLALPEIVDPLKLERDREQLGEITRAFYPLLRPVVVSDPDAPAAGRNQIHLTGRTVFGFEKPPRLQLRMQLVGADGKILMQKDRGDSDDPRGWMLYDLVSSFELPPKTPIGPLDARLLIGRNDSWPRLGDPVHEVRFWHVPGYHRRAWALFEKTQKLLDGERIVSFAARDADFARLAVLQEEVLRPLLGRDYIHRSWPLHALDAAHRLADMLAARESAAGDPVESVEALPEAGDRTFGIVAGKGDLRRVLPLRVVWGRRAPRVDPKLLFVLPPGGHDENWMIDGLGLDPATVQAIPGAVVAFAHEPLDSGYLEAARDFLSERFGTDTTRTTLAGFLDGGTRARFAFPKFRSKLAELAFVGLEIPDLQTLGNTLQIGRIRVVSAYGFPSRPHVERLRRLPNYESQKSRLFLDLTKDRPRSMLEAFQRLLETSFRTR